MLNKVVFAAITIFFSANLIGCSTCKKYLRVGIEDTKAGIFVGYDGDKVSVVVKR